MTWTQIRVETGSENRDARALDGVRLGSTPPGAVRTLAFGSMPSFYIFSAALSGWNAPVSVIVPQVAISASGLLSVESYRHV